MDARIFDLIDSINREGLTNSEWGLAPRVVNSKYYFGVEEDVKFPGQVLYIYGTNLEDFAYGGCQIRMLFLPSRIVLRERFSFGTFKS